MFLGFATARVRLFWRWAGGAETVRVALRRERLIWRRIWLKGVESAECGAAGSALSGVRWLKAVEPAEYGVAGSALSGVSLRPLPRAAAKPLPMR